MTKETHARTFEEFAVEENFKESALPSVTSPDLLLHIPQWLRGTSELEFPVPGVVTVRGIGPNHYGLTD